MPVIRIEIPGAVVPQKRPRATTVNRHVSLYDPSDCVDFKALVALYASETLKSSGYYHYPESDAKGFSVAVTIYTTPPKSFSKRRFQLSQTGLIRPKSKPDLDNSVKGIMDALKGIAWKDDAEVTSLSVAKFYGDSEYFTIEIAWEED